MKYETNFKSSLRWRFMRDPIRVSTVMSVLVLGVSILASQSILVGICVLLAFSGTCAMLIYTTQHVAMRRVIAPLIRLVEKAEKLGSGDKRLLAEGLQIEFKGRDEIAKLELAMVDMVTQRMKLEGANAQLVATYQATLDNIKTGTMLMLDAVPFCCQVFNERGMVIDCNLSCVKLFKFKNKEIYKSDWNMLAYAPPYQSDGTISADKWRAMFAMAFKQGSCDFEWMYSVDSELIPTGVTLQRVDRAGMRVIVASIIDLRHIKKLEKEAASGKFDFLTGIYNRRAFDAEGSKLFEEQKAAGRKFTLLYMDIDFFKKYNDTYGHNQGDVCLKSVAGALREVGEQTGALVARFGGEEFVVALSNVMDEDGARRVASLVCDSVRGLKIEHLANENVGYVTMSVGVCSDVPKDTETITTFIERADGALYKAKESGRNRFVMESEL